MLENKTVAEFGPSIDWRESSFLSNPRLPKAVNESRVKVCPGGQTGVTTDRQRCWCSGLLRGLGIVLRDHAQGV
jgi:hypothetical protein